MIRKIFKNTSYLISAQILGKGLSFFYSLYLVKVLSIESFGLYSVALSYLSIVSAISDFGISRFLTREISKGVEHSNSLLFSVIILRSTAVCVTFMLFAVFFSLFDNNYSRINLSLLAILAVIPQSVALTLDALFVAIQKISISAFGIVILTITTMTSGYIFLSHGFREDGAILAVLVGQLVSAIFFGVVLIKLKRKDFKRSHFDFKLLKGILRGALPYGVLGIIGLISFKVDTLMISYFRGDYETGIYGAAYRFLEATTFIPASVSVAFFPVIAKLFVEGEAGGAQLKSIKKIYFKSMLLMIVLGVLTAVGFIFVLPIFIELYFPKYLLSIVIIKILALAIPFIFLHIPSGQVLLSTDKYFKHLFIIYLSLLIINLVLYSTYIPIFGYIAAAWVTVFSEGLTFVVFFSFINFKVFGQYNK